MGNTFYFTNKQKTDNCFYFKTIYTPEQGCGQMVDDVGRFFRIFVVILTYLVE